MTPEELVRTPQRIQLRRTKGWRKPEGAVVVARPSKWGNPFKVERSWEGIGWLCRAVCRACEGPWRSSSRTAAADAVDLFRLHIGPFGSCELSEHDLEPLRGHDLACWCPLDQPCHADVLLELANTTVTA